MVAILSLCRFIINPLVIGNWKKKNVLHPVSIINKKDEFTFHVIKFWKNETVCSGSRSGANWKVETASVIILPA